MNSLLYYITLSINVITIILSLLLLGIFLFKASSRNDKFELIVFITISNLLASVSYIMEPNDEGDFCFLQGFLMILSQISIVICSTLLGFYTKQSIAIIEIEKSRFTCKRRFFHFLFGYFISFTISIFIFTRDAIGFNENFCWISLKKEGHIMFLVLYFIIQFLAIICNGYFSISIRFFFTRNTNLTSEEISLVKKSIWSNFIFPIIQLICLSLLLSSVIIYHSNQFKYISLIPSLMSCQGFITILLFSVRIGLLKLIKCEKKKLKKSELYNSGGEIFGKTASLDSSLVDSIKEEPLEDIGKGYMN